MFLLASACRYGPQPRNVMDIYVPSTAAHMREDGVSSANDSLAPSSGPAGVQAGAPVALFCHGGVWATGVQSTGPPCLCGHKKCMLLQQSSEQHAAWEVLHLQRALHERQEVMHAHGRCCLDLGAFVYTSTSQTQHLNCTATLAMLVHARGLASVLAGTARSSS